MRPMLRVKTSPTQVLVESRDSQWIQATVPGVVLVLLFCWLAWRGAHVTIVECSRATFSCTRTVDGVVTSTVPLGDIAGAEVTGAGGRARLQFRMVPDRGRDDVALVRNLASERLEREAAMLRGFL